MEFNFKYKFGKTKTTIGQYALIGFVLSIIVPLLAKALSTSELEILDFIDETQKLWFSGGPINDYFLNHPQLIERRVEREVDSAIENYNALTGSTKEVTIDGPVFTEEVSGETALGGELRLSSPWDANPIEKEL